MTGETQHPIVSTEFVRAFCSYSHADDRFRREFQTHIAVLLRRGWIELWTDRCIKPGADWRADIDRSLDSAELIVLLISSDFLASDFCYDSEMERALERHRLSDATVLPVIVRPCLWQDSPLGTLQALPEGKPVTSWYNRDEAWLNVARGIKIAIRNALERAHSRLKTLAEAEAAAASALGALLKHGVAISGLTGADRVATMTSIRRKIAEINVDLGDGPGMESTEGGLIMPA